MTNSAMPQGWMKGNRLRIAAWGGAAALLALPAVAMRLTAEVQWTASDFVAMGLLMGGTGLLIEVAVRLSPHWAYRTAACIALFTCFFQIWVNLAVGIIGSENNDLNGWFAAVPLTAAAGSVLAGFAPRGMRAAMGATLAVQLAIAIIAWQAGYNILPITALFCTLWLLAAGLFGRAAADQ